MFLTALPHAADGGITVDIQTLIHNHGGTQSHFGGRIVPARSTLTPEATTLVSDASPECKPTDNGYLVCKRWLWRATSNCTATNGTLLSYGPGMSPQILKPQPVTASSVGSMVAAPAPSSDGVVRGGTGAVIDFSLPPGVTNGVVSDCSFTDSYYFGLRPGVSNSAVRGLAPMLACMEVCCAA